MTKNKTQQSADVTAIILAGGKGKRMQSSTPKQYMQLGNQKVIDYSLQRLQNLVSKVIVIVPEKKDAGFIADGYPSIEIAEAAETRIASLLQELEKVKTKYVLIHDSSRPFLTEEVFNAVVRALDDYPCAYPVIDLGSSIVLDYNDFLAESPDRSQYREVQTPQGFHTDILKDALEKHGEKHIHIPELVRMLGKEVKHVPGSPWLFKITYAPDIHAAEYYAKHVINQ
jgi:2-C-methyl-D-erythritol 4-phosphate cytidylyltransferase